MPLADWTVPFNLTSKVYTNHPIPLGTAPDPLPINSAVTFPGGDAGIYFLRPDGCSLQNQVRQTKEFVPQQDGAILHRRFLAGMEMNLAIQLWDTADKVACFSLLQDMLDTLMGYLYGLLNAGDNEGRISWTPEGESTRMLDDIRLLSYPVESQQPGGPYEIGVTLDCALPYAENLTQLAPAVPGTVINYGNRTTFPVWQIYNGSGANFAFTLTNSTTSESFAFDDSLPGCANVGVGEYVEIDTFRNSVTKVKPAAVAPVTAADVLSNVAAGVAMLDTGFFLLVPGSNVITLTATTGSIGASSKGLINAAWAN
jgi:hypothetical protein